MRVLRYLIPAFPFYAWLLVYLLSLVPSLTGLVAISGLIRAFYFYSCAWQGGEIGVASRELPNGLLLCAIHWITYYVLYLLITRRMSHGNAILTGLGMMFLSIILAYFVLGKAGYGVGLYFNF